jgi:glutamyl-tRNA synthetase
LFQEVSPVNVRVRYAPSPTGFQHIGGVRTALYNYLYARRTGGTFALRIEDTDRKRTDPEAVKDISETFAWLGFRWTEGPESGGPFGPYVQSERSDIYRAHAEKLVAGGHAYRCYCTPERIAKLRQEQQSGEAGEGADPSAQGYDRHCRSLTDAERRAAEAAGTPFVVRLKVPLEGCTTYTDVILGEITIENGVVNPDPVLLKSDGFPTYHLANVVDDHLMEITHIMRGQEWLPSVPIHVLLYKAFRWTPPSYCHLPMVMGKDGHKLSKRLGSTAVRDFRAKGYLPDALLNCIAMVGWSYDGTRELFTLKELEELFDLEKLSKSPGVFDYQKLEWFNGMYIRAKSAAELADLITPFMKKEGLPVSDRALLEGVAGLIRERIKTLAEVPGMVRFLFEEPAAPSLEDLVPKKSDPAAARTALSRLDALLPELNGSDEENEARLRALAEELTMKMGDMLMPLRVALTGSRVSPPLLASIRVMGIEKARSRAQRAIRIIDDQKARS